MRRCAYLFIPGHAYDARCTAADYAGRCEHKLSNVDDGSGNNVNAVAMGVEAQTALGFYKDHAMSILTGTTLTVYIAEDPRGGGTPTCDSIMTDDEWVDTNDLVAATKVLALTILEWCGTQVCRYVSASHLHRSKVRVKLCDRQQK